MLICLIIAGKTQSLHLLSMQNMIRGTYSYILQYSGLLKQSGSGRNNPIVELSLSTRSSLMLYYCFKGIFETNRIVEKESLFFIYKLCETL